MSIKDYEYEDQLYLALICSQNKISSNPMGVYWIKNKF